jgi:hypothetical protein
MMPSHPRVITVLGMHRCGTSAITRGLRAMGVELGSNLMLAQQGINEKGFWEDVDLNRLNVEMLEALETDWHHLFSPPPGFVDSLHKNGFLLRAVDLLRSKVGDSACFGFKDPRVTQLLPFWREVFTHAGLETGYVLAIRNPISVVESLQRRDGFDMEKSILLWLSYTVAMLEGTMGERNRVIVDYDRLLDAPERELRRISAVMGRALIPTEIQLYKSEFLDAGLRHSVYGAHELTLDKFIWSVVGDLYSRLLAVASDELEIDAPALEIELTRCRGELNRWTHSSTLINKLYASKRSMVLEHSKRESQLREQLAEGDELRRQINAAHGALNAAEQSLLSRSDDLAQKETQLGIVEETLAKREEQISHLTRNTAKCEDRISELTRSVERQRVEFENLSQSLLSESGKLESANRLIDLLEQNAVRQAELLESREARISKLEKSVELKDRISLVNERVATVAEWRLIHLERVIARRDHESRRLDEAPAPRSATDTKQNAYPELNSLLVLDGLQFLSSAFQTVLGRPPDLEASSYYLDRIKSRSSKIKILTELLGSRDSHSRKLKMRGLRRAIVLDRLAGISFVGYFIRNNK